jgi:hypothetical protein
MTTYANISEAFNAYESSQVGRKLTPDTVSTWISAASGPETVSFTIMVGVPGTVHRVNVQRTVDRNADPRQAHEVWKDLVALANRLARHHQGVYDALRG